MTRLRIWAPDGLPEIGEGADLAALVLGAHDLVDGDIVCVTSKVISKAEGRVRTGDRDSAIEEETVRVVARRGATRIVRNRLGLTMAAAGVDASNVTAGSIVLLPLDPDASARTMRARIHARAGVRVAVIVTDTAGRAWREGQTDIAIGAAGLLVAEDYGGRTDSYGNPLAVTLPAVADELASAAELAQGKLRNRPIAIIRGRPDLVLALDDDGPGAAWLNRAEGGDLFGYGAREAVVRALRADGADRAPFGAPAPVGELVSAVQRVCGTDLEEPAPPTSALGTGLDQDPESARVRLPPGADRTAVCAVGFAHGWQVTAWEPAGSDIVCHLSRLTP